MPKRGLKRRHLDREISWGRKWFQGKHVATFVASFAKFYEAIKSQVAKKEDVIMSATLTGFEPVFCQNAYIHVHVRRQSAK